LLYVYLKKKQVRKYKYNNNLKNVEIQLTTNF